MATVLFCPVTFNLAETTRMIQVARAMDPSHRVLFLGYEEDYAPLIRDAGFEYLPCAPVFTPQQRDQLVKLDQGKTLKSLLTVDLVSARVDAERRVIRERDVAAVVTGSNLTSFISARAEGVPLYFPVPFALTRPQVEQARHLFLVTGRGRLANLADRVATSFFRWTYTRAPLAPRALSKVAVANGAPRMPTLASLLTVRRHGPAARTDLARPPVRAARERHRRSPEARRVARVRTGGRARARRRLDPRRRGGGAAGVRRCRRGRRLCADHRGETVR